MRPLVPPSGAAVAAQAAAPMGVPARHLAWFHSPALAAKVAHQLGDVLAVCGRGLPGWVADLGGAHAHLLPFEARRELLKHLDREIRSPLTSILGYADLIGADASPEDLCEVRGVIERAGDRFWVGAQWHPEMAAERELFGGLVEAAAGRA